MRNIILYAIVFLAAGCSSGLPPDDGPADGFVDIGGEVSELADCESRPGFDGTSEVRGMFLRWQPGDRLSVSWPEGAGFGAAAVVLEAPLLNVIPCTDGVIVEGDGVWVVDAVCGDGIDVHAEVTACDLR